MLDKPETRQPSNGRHSTKSMTSNEEKYQCKCCQRVFARSLNCSLHQSTCEHKQQLKRKANSESYKQTGGAKKKVKHDIKDDEIETAFDNAVVIYKIRVDNVNQSDSNIIDYIRDLINVFKSKIKNELESKTSIKIYFSLFANFHLAADVEYKTNPTPCLSSASTNVFFASNIDEILEAHFQKLCVLIDNFEFNGSGWILDEIVNVHLNVLEYKPIYGSTYFALPPQLASKKAIINVQNKDEKCFVWAVLAAIKLDEKFTHPERISHYEKYEHDLNLEGITFPVSLKDINKFEKNNDISVSVYGWEKEHVKDDSNNYFLYPLRVAKTVKHVHTNLLLVEKNGNQHYCTIKDFGKLARTKNETSRKIYCRFCLHGFCYNATKTKKNYIKSDVEAQTDLMIHEHYCSQNGSERIKFPEEGFLRFKNVKNQLKSRFVVYADFEAILLPYQDENQTDASQKYQRHKLVSYAYKIVSDVPNEKFELRQYMGSNAVNHFFMSLKNDFYNQLLPKLETIVQIQFDANDKIEFKNVTHCIICEKHLKHGEEIVVRDHDHATGKFRGAAHQLCNLQYSVDKKC